MVKHYNVHPLDVQHERFPKSDEFYEILDNFLAYTRKRLSAKIKQKIKDVRGN